MEVVCKKCGVVDDYTAKMVTFSNGTKHNQATCNSCDSFIKYLPQEKTDFALYKGKHVGRKISEMTSQDDLNYLNWALQTDSFFRQSEKEIVAKHLKKGL